MSIEIGIAQQPKAGQALCGDAVGVTETERYTVVALADGLGSGPKAHHAARLAVQGVTEHANYALDDILSYCHYALLSSGGVGVMLVVLRLERPARRLEFSGVGDIRFLAHSREPIQPVSRYGYLGTQLPRLHTFRFPYTPGDIFILHTDGISSRLHLHNHLDDLARGAQFFANLVLQTYGKSHDDATVVVVRTDEQGGER